MELTRFSRTCSSQPSPSQSHHVVTPACCMHGTLSSCTSNSHSIPLVNFLHPVLVRWWLSPRRRASTRALCTGPASLHLPPHQDTTQSSSSGSRGFRGSHLQRVVLVITTRCQVSRVEMASTRAGPTGRTEQGAGVGMVGVVLGVEGGWDGEWGEVEAEEVPEVMRHGVVVQVVVKVEAGGGGEVAWEGEEVRGAHLPSTSSSRELMPVGANRLGPSTSSKHLLLAVMMPALPHSLRPPCHHPQRTPPSSNLALPHHRSIRSPLHLLHLTQVTYTSTSSSSPAPSHLLLLGLHPHTRTPSTSTSTPRHLQHLNNLPPMLCSLTTHPHVLLHQLHQACMQRHRPSSHINTHHHTSSSSSPSMRTNPLRLLPPTTHPLLPLLTRPSTSSPRPGSSSSSRCTSINQGCINTTTPTFQPGSAPDGAGERKRGTHPQHELRVWSTCKMHTHACTDVLSCPTGVQAHCCMVTAVVQSNSKARNAIQFGYI
jgi:hypothetical protein